MAFCPNCGAQVEGKFCAKCGAAVAANAPGGTVPGPAPPVVTQISAPGLAQNVASALCYLLLVLTGILFLVIEPYNKNKTIRFHAFQAIFFWLAAVAMSIIVAVVTTVLGSISFLGFWTISLILYRILELAVLVVWLMLM